MTVRSTGMAFGLAALALLAPLGGAAVAQGAEGAAIVPPEVAQQEEADGAPSPTVTARQVAASGSAEDVAPARIAVEIESLDLAIGRLSVTLTLDDDRADALSEVLRGIVEAAETDSGGE